MLQASRSAMSCSKLLGANEKVHTALPWLFRIIALTSLVCLHNISRWIPLWRESGGCAARQISSGRKGSTLMEPRRWKRNSLQSRETRLTYIFHVLLFLRRRHWQSTPATHRPSPSSRRQLWARLGRAWSLQHKSQLEWRSSSPPRWNIVRVWHACEHFFN